MISTTNYTEDITDFTPDYVGHEAEVIAEGEAAMARLVKGANSVHDKLRVARAFLVGQAEAREAEAAGGRYSAAFNKWLRLHPRLRLFSGQDRAAALWLLDPANWPDARRVLKRFDEPQRLRAGLHGIKHSVLEERGEAKPRAKAMAERKAMTGDNPIGDWRNDPVDDIVAKMIATHEHKAKLLMQVLMQHFNVSPAKPKAKAKEMGEEAFNRSLARDFAAIRSGKG
jgi:hypothetical protein